MHYCTCEWLENNVKQSPFSYTVGLMCMLQASYIFFLSQVDAYDGLPTHVCRQCVNQVNVSYNFKRQCEISDAAFRELLRNHRSGSQSSEVVDSNIPNTAIFPFPCSITHTFSV